MWASYQMGMVNTVTGGNYDANFPDAFRRQWPATDTPSFPRKIARVPGIRAKIALIIKFSKNSAQTDHFGERRDQTSRRQFENFGKL